MNRKAVMLAFCVLLVLSMVLTACQPSATPTAAPAATDVPVATSVPQNTEAPTEEAKDEKLPFGLLLIGPANDHGWSQAHVDGAAYMMSKLPETEMMLLENVFQGPGGQTQTGAELATDMVLNKNARVIIFNSDDMKDNAVKFAQEHPDIMVIHASGDTAWQEGENYVDLPNLKNIMGRMEYGKMMAGCAAALTTETGKIGFLGPLINDETRRLAASAYLGARYCWTEYGKKDPKDLEFKVTWIGFWFNLPGTTLDPTQVADDFYNTGYDVVISSIDTTEALTEARKFAAEGKKVWAVPYDYKDACTGADDVCLGVPYFNWGPAYVEAFNSAIDGTWKGDFVFVGPDWKDINNPDTSAIGFTKGGALSAENATTLDQFIAALGGGLNLWAGPLNYQDGSVFVKEGEFASEFQIWYLPLLLEGMEGKSE